MATKTANIDLPILEIPVEYQSSFKKMVELQQCRDIKSNKIKYEEKDIMTKLKHINIVYPTYSLCVVLPDDKKINLSSMNKENMITALSEGIESYIDNNKTLELMNFFVTLQVHDELNEIQMKIQILPESA